ncbi:MAG: hypothetical protein IKI58_12755 [Oscillospiraceae bacterium]|nr:hypothetical protein [Oscillospiraceae bacterium]
MKSSPNPQIPEAAAEKVLSCLRCGAPMKPVATEEYTAGSLLLKQLQKIIANAGIRVYHCTGCGKIELFK